MPARRRPTVPRFALLIALATLVAALAASRAAARPDAVQIVLNPDRDTFLGESVGRAQDGAADISTGWVYTTRTRQYRAYLHFPLDPARHPATGLLQAELWLLPRGKPETSQLAANFRVQTLTEALVDGRVAPNWFAAGDPSVEQSLDTVRVEWKVFRIRDMVIEMLNNPGGGHGFAITGVEPQDNTRFDFISREGDAAYPDGNQPRLVLTFRDDAFPTATRVATETPTVTATRTATATLAPTNTPAATAVPSAPRTATATATGVPAAPVLLPRLYRGR